NGDISEWDVSSVIDMYNMFANSIFNGDISNWDVSCVTNMADMFDNSIFNGDISNWDVSCVTNMADMFDNSQFNGDLSQWVIFSLENGEECISKFRKNVIKQQNIIEVIPKGFEECPVTNEIIVGDYLKCNQCKRCFDILVKDWIIEHSSCPYCRTKWRKLIIYEQKQTIYNL
ncbi:BspA family leucine-rich repeat surface protein, partial [bacterium]|nr:BspA family leucine-rich repeat surface protein [bacterium]